MTKQTYIDGSYYGNRGILAPSGKKGPHTGEDIALAVGQEIRAIGPGTIREYRAANGYGELVVVIEHPLPRALPFSTACAAKPSVCPKGAATIVTTDRILSIYGHLRASKDRDDGKALAFKPGDSVKAGQLIGYINDGAHNGDGAPHLHMGVRLTGWWNDATKYFRGYGGDCTFCADFAEPHLAIPQLQATDKCSFEPGQGLPAETAAFKAAYQAEGGRDALGCATGPVSTSGFPSFQGTAAHYQNFERGAVEYLPSRKQAYAVAEPVFSRWKALGFGSGNPLGYPLGPARTDKNRMTGTAYRMQPFEGGDVYAAAGRPAIALYDPQLRSKYGSTGGGTGSPLGLPTSEVRQAVPSSTGRSGIVMDFERGHLHLARGLYASGVYEAYVTEGPIDQKYVALKGTGGCLGFPVTDKYWDPKTVAWRNDFEGGWITAKDGAAAQHVCLGAPPRARVTVRVFNCDDTGRARLNGMEVVSTGFAQDSGSVDLTTRLVPGTNRLEFELVNTGGGIAYGFQVLRDGQVLFDKTCGTAGVTGCDGNASFGPGVVRRFTYDFQN